METKQRTRKETIEAFSKLVNAKIDSMIIDYNEHLAISGSIKEIAKVVAWALWIEKDTGKKVFYSYEPSDDPEDPDFAVCRLL